MRRDKRGKFIPMENNEFIGTVIKCGRLVKYVGRTITVKPEDKNERYILILGCPIVLRENSKIKVFCYPNGIYRYTKVKNWTVDFGHIYNIKKLRS